MKLLTMTIAAALALFSGNTFAAEESDASSSGQADAPTDVAEEAEALIQRVPSVDDYQGFERCIDMRRIRTTKVLDERHVVVEMRQKEYYVIQLPRRCPGLRRNRPVMTEPRGRQFCQFDSIRPMYQNGFGGIEWGTPCTIPGFHAVTKEQVVQLRESLAEERKRLKRERRERRKSRDKAT